MRFKSPHPGLLVLCRSETKPLYNDNGDMTREGVRRLTADFGLYADESYYIDEVTGNQVPMAEIRGGFYDTEAMQQKEGWTDSERELVERKMLELCDQQPGIIQVFEDPQVLAPWDTYDHTAAKEIADLALKIGRVDHALVYEEQNANRKTVVAALRAVKGEADEAIALEAEKEAETDDLVAAIN